MAARFARCLAARRAFSTSQIAYDSKTAVLLGVDTLRNGLGQPDAEVLERTELFHTDAVFCGLSALALQCNAPTILREEALEYVKADGARVFGSDVRVHPEKASLANGSAVREWDSNGTVFGFS